MTKKDQDRFDKLMQSARDAAFEAAEAMDRADLKEWTRLQNHAEDLRKRASKIAKKKTPATKQRKTVG